MPYQLARLTTLLILVSGLLSTLPLCAQQLIDARADVVSIRALGNDTAAAFLIRNKIKLQFAELSTISALEAVANGQVAMALSARGMHADNEKEKNLVFVPIAWEAIVAITHPDNPVKNLTLRNLSDIYAGRIKTWDQVGGRAEPIHLVAVAGPMDGVEYGLRKALFGRGHIPIAAERWYLNTLQLEAAIAIDPNGLAVSALSNVMKNSKLKRLTVDGVPATRSNVKQGEYLLVTPIYLVHRADELPAGLVGRYLTFLKSDRPSRLAMQHKKLLPIRKADVVQDIFTQREQKLLAMLEPPPSIEPAAVIAASAAAVTKPEAANTAKTADKLP